jgi:hypothetical protein
MSKISYFAAFALSLVWITSQRANAQNPASYYEEVPRTFFGGLIAGANFTQVDGDRFAGYHKIGLNAGAIVYANLAPHLAGSIEILFSQKGARAHKAQESASRAFVITKYNINLNYAEVPLMLNYFDRHKSNIGAGLSIARLINATEKAEQGQALPPIPDFDQYPFRKMDYNFIVGGNLHCWKGIYLNARFQYSLRSIRDKQYQVPEYSGRSEQFSNMWTVRVMYLFD